MLVEHPAADQYDHSTLRYIIYAGAPMYREDQKAALKKLGGVLVQYFGLGEVTGNITVLPPGLHDPEDGPHARIGTCGFERTGMQVSIQDDNGRELKPFETGEICVIGPAVFAGYYDNPEANAKAFRDGWFRTGDLGHVDEEGFVYITGRASDMYISGGSNIYPREVEEKILTHPAIGEVAVLGVPDPFWGEVGIAVCVPREGAKPVSEAEMAAFLAPKVPRYKMPKRFLFWEALPKSGYGKVPKRMVRDELEARGLLGRDCRQSRGRDQAEAEHRAARPRGRTHPMGGGPWVRFLLYYAGRLAAAGSRGRGFAAAGFAGGVLNMRGGALGPFAYVMPALSKTREHAAFYSDTFRPAGVTRLKIGAMTLGERDGAPFFHAMRCGPRRTAASTAGISCRRRRSSPNRLRWMHSASTARYSWPSPIPRRISSCSARSRRRGGAKTIRSSRCGCGRTRILPVPGSVLPATRHRQARLHGGVGSTIGARFTDGGRVVPFATELAIGTGEIAPADPKRRIATTVWDAGDGVRLRSSAASEYGPRVAKSADGKLWFVTGEGIQVIDPRHLVVNETPPPVHIEQVTADGQSFDPTNGLRLPGGMRDVLFDFTALSLAASDKVRFRVKLEGQDNDWRELVNQRHVHYTNLPPHPYRFRVMAANNSGVWNEAGATLDFSIAPAIYQTNWFRALGAALLAGVLWAAWQLRLRQLGRRLEMTLGRACRRANPHRA